MKIVGVTKCPTGIAHTYMAAEKIEQAAKALGYEAKVETQGSQGTENRLTAQDIKEADYVLISADVAIDEKDRFNGKMVHEMGIKGVIADAEKVIKELPQTAKKQGGVASQGESEGSGAGSAIKMLMNGASHMIPFVVVGGLFIALSIALGGKPTADGMVVSGVFWEKMNAIGSAAFGLMYPILAGFIAFAIAGRASLAPAMICAQVAVSPDILGTQAGTGFLGCIVVGYAAGYLTKWFNSWNVPKALKPIMPIFVIPLLGTGIIGGAFILVLGKPIAMLMTALNGLLASLAASPATAIPLGLVLGAMVAVACAIPVPPLAMGVATFIARNKFTEEEQGSGLSAFLMGLIGITEGAIPFASADPKRVLPSIIIGSAVAGALGMVLGITDSVPHGGSIVGVLGATNSLPLFLVCIVAGTAVAGVLYSFLKKDLKTA